MSSHEQPRAVIEGHNASRGDIDQRRSNHSPGRQVGSSDDLAINGSEGTDQLADHPATEPTDSLIGIGKYASCSASAARQHMTSPIGPDSPRPCLSHGTPTAGGPAK